MTFDNIAGVPLTIIGPVVSVAAAAVAWIIAKAVAPLLPMLVVFPATFAADNKSISVDLERDRAGLLRLGLSSFGIASVNRVLTGADQLSRFVARVPSLGQ